MAGPPIPALFEHLGQRPFSFYPAIVNIEHNEWTFRRATWSDVQVMNTKTRVELWVPRRYLGEVSLIEEPVMIVGLVKELEYRAGALLPHIRQVIEMPRVVNDSPRPRITVVREERPAPVVGIRLEEGARSRASRVVVAWFAAGILACVSVAIFFRDVIQSVGRQDKQSSTPVRGRR